MYTTMYWAGFENFAVQFFYIYQITKNLCNITTLILHTPMSPEPIIWVNNNLSNCMLPFFFTGHIRSFRRLPLQRGKSQLFFRLLIQVSERGHLVIMNAMKILLFDNTTSKQQILQSYRGFYCAVVNSVYFLPAKLIRESWNKADVF